MVTIQVGEIYLVAKKVFEADNRCIYDATIGGRLKIFPKVDDESIFRLINRITQRMLSCIKSDQLDKKLMDSC